MEFYTKIAGVTFEGRQRLIYNLLRSGQLTPGTELTLKREPYNMYDSNAIAVLLFGQQLGYISKECANNMAKYMDGGTQYRAFVSDITGGDVGMSYGINIRITYEFVSRNYDYSNNHNDYGIDVIPEYEIDDAPYYEANEFLDYEENDVPDYDVDDVPDTSYDYYDDVFDGNYELYEANMPDD